MRVRILRSIAAAEWAYQVGDIVDMEPARAMAWCAGERPICEPVDRADVIDEATIAPPETAARRPRRKRG